MLVGSQSAILLSFAYFHTPTSAAVSPVPSFGLDLKLPEALQPTTRLERHG